MQVTSSDFLDPAAERSSREILTDSLALGVAFAISLTVIQRALGFIRGLLFCRLMTDEELGQFSLISGALMMLAPLAVLGLPGSFGRFVEHFSHSKQLNAYLSYVSKVCSASTGLVAFALLLVPDAFSWLILGQIGHRDIVYLAAVGLLALTWCNYLTSLVESLRQVRLASLMRFASGVSFTLAGALLLVVLPGKTQAAIIALAVSSVLGAIPAWWFLRSRRDAIRAHDQPLSRGELFRRISPFAIWWWVSNILHNSYELADRYLLICFGQMTSSEIQSAVGQIHSGRLLPTLMVGIASMLSGLLMPYVTAAWVRGQRDRARQQLNWTIKLAALGISAVNASLLVASPLMFDWVLQGRYANGLAVLPAAIVYCSWLSLLTVSQDYLWVIEKGKLAVLSMVIGLCATIVVAWWLVPVAGMWGAVYATLVGNLIALVGIYGFNFLTGCPPDRGVWLTIGLPMFALCGPGMAATLTLAFAILVGKTNFYFSDQEKRQIRQLISDCRARFKHR